MTNLATMASTARTDRHGFVPCPPSLASLTEVLVSTEPGVLARPEFRSGRLAGVRVYRPNGYRVRLRRVRVSWTSAQPDKT